jgi:hypothetical protein
MHIENFIQGRKWTSAGRSVSSIVGIWGSEIVTAKQGERRVLVKLAIEELIRSAC